MRCPKCDAEMEMSVQVTVIAPSSMYAQLSKKNFAKKGVWIQGVNWDAANFVCKSCRYVDLGFSNYVKKLEEENKHLRKLVKSYESDDDL